MTESIVEKLEVVNHLTMLASAPAQLHTRAAVSSITSSLRH